MSAVRWVLGGLGVLVGAYGAWLALTRQDLLQLAEVALWLAAGVAVHDALVAGVVIGASLLGRRVLPRPWHAPATLGLVVWGSVSVMAVPVLGRFGARADNPTLLDRPYLATWLVLTLLTLAAIGVAGLVRSRRTEA
jgi:ABC-type branched-subunit amino acid transport system permease subunit